MKIMKSKISVLIIMFLMSVGVNAQIDRTKQPESGPAPKISLDTPTEFQLKNGLTVLVVENHKLPRASFSLRIDNTPIAEGKKAGTDNILSTMLGNGTTSIPKDKFNEEIDFLGVRLSFGSQRAFASCLSKYSNRIIELLADATMNPLLTEEEFQKEKEKLSEGLKTQEKSIQSIANRVRDALTYGASHPYGEFISDESLNNIALTDVVDRYNRNFNPKNAYLVVIGDVDTKKIKSVIKKQFGAWSNSDIAQIEMPKTKANTQNTVINFVDMPNAVQSNIILTNNVELKMSDDDYHAALIANYIFGGGATGYLFQNLRDDKAYTYGSYSRIGASRYGASRFLATAEVRNEVTDSSVIEMLKEVKRIRTEPVTAETLSAAKAAYSGSFVMALERPQTIANYALNIKLNNLPVDFYKNYLQNINAVTIEDVQKAAKKFILADKARIVIVGKGSDVLTNLEKTGIPINYYDKYANEVSKPEFTKPIPDGVTAQSVINNYIKAIGGKEKAMLVKTLYKTANVSVKGVPVTLTAEIKEMAPNKQSMEMAAEGMGVIMKQKFNGETGYMEQQGMKKDLSPDEIAEKNASQTIFPELYYKSSEMILESIITIEDQDAYKIKVILDDKPSFRFYSVETGLLLKEKSTTETQGQKVTSIVDYGAYTTVNDLKLPHSLSIMAGPQNITMEITSIKVNEGVSESDFN